MQYMIFLNYILSWRTEKNSGKDIKNIKSNDKTEYGG